MCHGSHVKGSEDVCSSWANVSQTQSQPEDAGQQPTAKISLPFVAAPCVFVTRHCRRVLVSDRPRLGPAQQDPRARTLTQTQFRPFGGSAASRVTVAPAPKQREKPSLQVLGSLHSAQEKGRYQQDKYEDLKRHTLTYC